jgi:hypothetical protein
MSKFTRLAAASTLLIATAAPAAASTLPELGLKAKKQAISIGFLDAAYDLALSDQLSAGVNASIGGGLLGLGGAEVEARATYLLAQPMPGLLVGATGGVGFGSAWGLGTIGAFGGFAPSVYAGPTVRWLVPLPLQKGQQVLFRATIPLTIPLGASAGWGLYGGGAELAWRYNANEEWVLGGGTSIIGWRKIY